MFNVLEVLGCRNKTDNHDFVMDDHEGVVDDNFVTCPVKNGIK